MIRFILLLLGVLGSLPLYASKATILVAKMHASETIYEGLDNWKKQEYGNVEIIVTLPDQSPSTLNLKVIGNDWIFVENDHNENPLTDINDPYKVGSCKFYSGQDYVNNPIAIRLCFHDGEAYFLKAHWFNNYKDVEFMRSKLKF